MHHPNTTPHQNTPSCSDQPQTEEWSQFVWLQPKTIRTETGMKNTSKAKKKEKTYSTHRLTSRWTSSASPNHQTPVIVTFVKTSKCTMSTVRQRRLSELGMRKRWEELREREIAEQIRGVVERSCLTLPFCEWGSDSMWKRCLQECEDTVTNVMAS